MSERAMQLTLVSHYGEKTPAIIRFVGELQSTLSERLHSAFHPYDIRQVHGTLVGLEGACVREDEEVFNRNFEESRGEPRVIDWEGLLAFVRHPSFPRLQIRLGGYRSHEDYGFTSRSEHPYVRGFSIQRGIAVVMGWPFAGEQYSNELDELRRSFQQFGVLHKWHRSHDDVDNDFFLVLGTVNAMETTDTDLASAQETVRNRLAHATCDLELSTDTLSFVSYVDPQLPTATSQQFKAADPTFDAVCARSKYRASNSPPGQAR